MPTLIDADEIGDIGMAPTRVGRRGGGVAQEEADTVDPDERRRVRAQARICSSTIVAAVFMQVTGLEWEKMTGALEASIAASVVR